MSKKRKLNAMLDDQDSSAETNSAPLSSEELELIAANREKNDRGELPHYDNSDVALAKRYAKKNKGIVIFVVITLVLVIAVIAVLSVLLYGKLAGAPSKDDITVTLGDEEYTVKYKKAMRDGVLYLDIVPIAKYAGLIVSGDEHSIKISCSDGTYVRFDHGESYATVNDEAVKLEGEASIARLDGDSEQKIECSVPFEFIDKLFSHQVEKGTVSMYASFSEKTNEVLFHKISYKDSGKPLPISFSADCFDVIIK